MVYGCVYARVRAYVRACACVHVRECVHKCVRACVRAYVCMRLSLAVLYGNSNLLSYFEWQTVFSCSSRLTITAVFRERGRLARIHIKRTPIDKVLHRMDSLFV